MKTQFDRFRTQTSVCASCNRVWMLLLAFIFLAGARPSAAYSLLSHEELVDILWKDQIQPLLLKRFPDTTSNQLYKAHAYAYGGCLIQDMGYFPFGNKFFSDLAHYVRTGDFVTRLIQDSADLLEYSFAMGALAHYSSDCSAHPLVNRAVALGFPKLRAKYGDTVTYENSPAAHLQTEFGFDLTQIAKKRYTSDQYHDFIGFEVSLPLLERAFLETYGLRLEEVLSLPELAIGTFRRAASQVIPAMTRAALTVYHPEIVKDVPNFSAQRFLFNLSRAQYEKEWGKDYQKPGFCTRLFGWVLRWIPKIGPLKALAFKTPTSEMEDLYIKSMNQTVEHYRAVLLQTGQGSLRLPNLDCDTGRPSRLGEYTRGDVAYARLLEEHFRRGFERLAPDLRENLLAFYNHEPPPQKTKKARKAWLRTASELQALRSGPGSAVEAEVRERLLRPPPGFFPSTASRVFGSRTNLLSRPRR